VVPAGNRVALPAQAYHWAAALTPGRIRSQTAAPLLFQAFHDRLEEAALARRCSTPRRTIDLATALAIPAPPFPA
jgi:serine/threonine protein phosphatase 1